MSYLDWKERNELTAPGSAAARAESREAQQRAYDDAFRELGPDEECPCLHGDPGSCPFVLRGLLHPADAAARADRIHDEARDEAAGL